MLGEEKVMERVRKDVGIGDGDDGMGKMTTVPGNVRSKSWKPAGWLAVWSPPISPFPAPCVCVEPLALDSEAGRGAIDANASLAARG
jgi:hypothetical protein